MRDHEPDLAKKTLWPEFAILSTLLLIAAPIILVATVATRAATKRIHRSRTEPDRGSSGSPSVP